MRQIGTGVPHFRQTVSAKDPDSGSIETKLQKNIYSQNPIRTVQKNRKYIAFLISEWLIKYIDKQNKEEK